MELQFNKNLLEAGCDEAGRGCLAGPVFAAAVILPTNFNHDLVRDSKSISKKNRLLMRTIIENEAISYGIGIIYPAEIDEINILNASIKAMHLALSQLNVTPEFILVDGNRFKPFQQIKHKCIIKGDTLYKNISAASILAKTYRDDYMDTIDNEYPTYSWKKNKGYPTIAHRAAILKNGICSYHRKTFKLLDEQFKIQF